MLNLLLIPRTNYCKFEVPPLEHSEKFYANGEKGTKMGHEKTFKPYTAAGGSERFVPIELPKICFEYFGLNEQSIQLLRRLRKELDGDFIKYFDAQYLDSE
jgi:hypothetical protein